MILVEPGLAVKRWNGCAISMQICVDGRRFSLMGREIDDPSITKQEKATVLLIRGYPCSKVGFEDGSIASLQFVASRLKDGKCPFFASGSMLQEKVALVTGSARGLGRAYALRLAKLGADVVINDVDLKAADEFNEQLSAPSVMDEVRNLGRRAIGVQADVSKKTDVDRMFKKILDEFGRIDLLVNNAGGRLRGGAGWASTVSPEDLRFIIDVNLVGTILCSQAASVPMKQQKAGNIINVSSIAGLEVSRSGRAADYCVAKAGVFHYTRLLAAELGPYGIRVNCIAPGIITSSRVTATGQAPEHLARVFPLGRFGTPEDCANVIEFLASDLSGYVTGQCITIDGGYSLTQMWPSQDVVF